MLRHFPARTLRSRRLLIGLALIVIIVVVVFGSAFALQRKLIYLPSGGPLPHAAEVLPGGADVALTTSDGLQLDAWFFPGEDASTGVLVAPGNAGNRSLRMPLAQALLERGLSVLLLDYRGYGGNPGKPSADGLARDVRAARDFLVHEAGFAPQNLLYFGESLGSAVVSELAIQHPPVGVLLRSPFTDLAAVGQRLYPFLPVRWLLRDTFPVNEYVAQLQAPITVVYGSADSIVPPEQSCTIARIANARAVEVPGADHNDQVLLNGPHVIDAVVDLATP